MMKKTTTILAILAAGLNTATAGVEPAPAPAPAPVHMPGPVEPIGYNNMELLYLNTEVDGNGGSLDGVSLRFEWAMAPHFYIAASGDYSTGDGGDYGPLDWGNLLDGTDLWTVRLGVGGSWALTEHIHLVGEVGGMYFDASTEVNVRPGPNDTFPGYHDTIGDSDWGWYVRPHLRAKWGIFEIHAGAEYQDAYENDWAFYGNVYFRVAGAWDLTAGIREGEDTTQWSAGVRWSY